MELLLETVFSILSVQKGYKKRVDVWELSWAVQGRLKGLVAGYWPDSKNVITEAEESALLRSVTRKWLVKAKWEVLVFAAMICKMWGLTVELELFVVTTCKWWINPIIQTPVYNDIPKSWQYVINIKVIEVWQN
jgi:hypothetical protein